MDLLDFVDLPVRQVFLVKPVDQAKTVKLVSTAFQVNKDLADSLVLMEFPVSLFPATRANKVKRASKAYLENKVNLVFKDLSVQMVHVVILVKRVNVESQTLVFRVNRVDLVTQENRANLVSQDAMESKETLVHVVFKVDPDLSVHQV